MTKHPTERPPSSRRRLRSIVATVFVASLLTGFASTGSSAGTANSAVGQYTVGSYTYRNYAQIVTNTSSHYVAAYTFTAPWGFTAPSGWVGSRGRLFTSSGAMYCEGSNTYNSSPKSSGSYQGGISCQIWVVGTWKSYGVSNAWNGSGYQSFYTFHSPYQNS